MENCYNCKNKGHTAACYIKPKRFYLAVSAELQEATVGNHEKPLIILLSLLPNNLFTDEALVVSCKLGNKDEIKTRLLLDIGATGIGFIDKKMAHHVCHVLQILLFSLAKSQLLKSFDGKPAWPIMHVIYLMLTVQSHSELLVFMLVTLLGQHPIILDKLWIQKHNVVSDMSCNKLIFWPDHFKHLGIKKLLV